MVNFLVSLIASLIAGIILLLGSVLFSKKWRHIFIGIFSRMLDIDIDYVYSDKKEAEADLQAEINKAQFVYVLAGRGNELQRDPFNALFLKRSKDIPTKILLPKTQILSTEYDWLMQREKELSRFDTAYGNGLLHQQVDSNVAFIKGYANNSKVELKRYNIPNIGRIVITDRCAFYTPYSKESHGRHSKVYKIRKNDEIYYNLMRLFDQLWEA